MLFIFIHSFVYSCTLALLFACNDGSRFSKTNYPQPVLYSENFPEGHYFQNELNRIRKNFNWTPSQENEVNREINLASMEIGAPKAILWCLLFQESRLNPLLGFRTDSLAKGIGQFIAPTFFEINFEQDKYSLNSQKIYENLIGADPRPIAAKPSNLNDPSNYFNLSTGIISSAIYLSNRYEHLENALRKSDIAHDSSLLWLYAAIAYNKGSRSVFSLWKTVEQKKGGIAFYKLLHDADFLVRQFQSGSLATDALSLIWTKDLARSYAKEWQTHALSISECALPNKNSRQAHYETGRVFAWQ